MASFLLFENLLCRRSQLSAGIPLDTAIEKPETARRLDPRANARDWLA
jgi:hypothetical protein